MATPGPYTLRDYQIDNLLAKEWISAWDVVKNVASQTAIFAPGTLSVGWSVGSPSFSQLPSSRVGGIRLAATTTQIDHLWRVPSCMDKNWPIYFRYHWTAQVGGTTPTVSFNQYYATLSSASSLRAVSPTSAIQTQIPASTNSGSTAQTGLDYNLTGRGAIAPMATGLAANQTMLDNTEMLHLTIQVVSTNWAIASLPLFWLGMDVEYTPRRTFGDGSRREGRKLESNLGFQEIGAGSDF
jgi:hypothetical protein